MTHDRHRQPDGDAQRHPAAEQRAPESRPLARGCCGRCPGAKAPDSPGRSSPPISSVNALQAKAGALSEAYERGETTDIAAVMLAREQSSVGFQATLQVRNKLLAAYKDINEHAGMMMSDLALRAPSALSPSRLGFTPNGVRWFMRATRRRQEPAAIGLIACSGCAAIVWMAMSQPPQRDLFPRPRRCRQGRRADTLKASNIAYSLDRDTGALTVSEGDFYQAEMLLAQQGLPKARRWRCHDQLAPARARAAPSRASAFAALANWISPARSRRSTRSNPPRSISPSNSRAFSCAIAPSPPHR
jgi:flagellar hook-basal body complex protein FliE